MEKNTVRLSQLSSETEISIEESSEVITVAELRQELLTQGDVKRANAKWYTVKEKNWQPNARTMIIDYIDQQCDDMYEDWDERALSCVNKEHIQKLQAVLDDAFKGNYATFYWVYDKKVIVDTFI